MNLPLFFFTKITEMKVKDFCFILNISLQDKENGGINSNILEAVPVKVRPRSLPLCMMLCSLFYTVPEYLVLSNPSL